MTASQHPECASHTGEHLQRAEKLAHAIATAQIGRSESVPPNTAATLLMTIDRLEHEICRGAPECNDTRQLTTGSAPHDNPEPGTGPGRHMTLIERQAWQATHGARQ